MHHTHTKYSYVCNILLSKLKRQYRKQEFEKATGNTKAIWNVIKYITNTNRQIIPLRELLDVNLNRKKML